MSFANLYAHVPAGRCPVPGLWKAETADLCVRCGSPTRFVHQPTGSPVCGDRCLASVRAACVASTPAPESLPLRS